MGIPLKKATAVILAFLITFTAGCANNDEIDRTIAEDLYKEPVYEWDATGTDTITVWCKDREMDRPYIQRAFARYEQLTKNKIEVVNIPAEEYTERVKAALSQPDGGGMDILASYGGTNIESFNPDQNFYDFTDAQWVKDTTISALNQAVYKGRIIGLPYWEASMSGTLYNEKLFKKFGIKVPTNQEEFLETCEKLKDNGVTPVYLPYKEVSMLLYQFAMDPFLEDQDLLNALNRGDVGYTDIKEMEQIVQWYKTMSDKGYFGSDYLQNDWDGMDPAMKSQMYGMMLCWDTWLYTNYTGNPEDFGIMPAFIGYPKGGTFEGPNLSIFMISQKSTKIEAALNFTTFLADPYNYNVTFKGVYTAPIFKNQNAGISTPQYLKTERIVQSTFYDSTAWLKVRGFDQMDAKYIQKYMHTKDGSYTIQDCLKDMEESRRKKAGISS